MKHCCIYIQLSITTSNTLYRSIFITEWEKKCNRFILLYLQILLQLPEWQAAGVQIVLLRPECPSWCWLQRPA
jgi:hypothetical protein